MKLRPVVSLCICFILAAARGFAQSDQTIEFDSIPNVTLGDNNLLLSPTASSGLNVTLTALTSNISLSGDTVTFLASGHATIDASQSGSGSFNPAPDVKRTFCINPPQPLVYFSESLGEVALTSSSSSGNQWFFNGVAIAAADGGTDFNFNVVNAGIYALQVTIDGCVSQKSTDQVVQALDQTITFDPIPDVSIDDSPIVAYAESTPGLIVTFASLLSNAEVSDSAIYLLQPGRATIVASQAGNYIFNAAPPVERSFCINPSKPTISSAITGETTILTSSNASGNQWYLNGNIINGATAPTYSPVATGTYTVQTITPDGCSSPISDGDMFTAVPVIPPMAQTITFGSIAAVNISQGTLDLSASASSNLSVVFAAGTTNISVSGTTATLLRAGHATITATQPGDSLFLPASNVSRTFCINPAKPTIAIDGNVGNGVLLASDSGLGNQWYFNGTIIAGATAPTFDSDSTGVYTVQVTVDNCVSALSDEFIVTITGLPANKEKTVELYPNPARDYLKINLPSGSMEPGASLAIIDLLGRVVNKTEVVDDNTELNISAFTPGTYIVRVNQNGRVSYARFVKY